MSTKDKPGDLACPHCKGPVEIKDDRLVCLECGRSSPVGQGLDRRRRMLLYGGIGAAAIAAAGIGLSFVPWEDLNTDSAEEFSRQLADAAKKYTPPTDVAHDPAPDVAQIEAASGPLYLFAHHHAAYYVIKKLQLEGRLPQRGNVLINFDSHDDVNVPFAAPNPEDRDHALAFLEDDSLPLDEKAARVQAFLRDKITITSWVFPLVDDGSLSAYYYVFPKRHPMEVARRRLAVVQLKRWMAGLDVVPGPKPPRVPEGFAFDVVRDDALPSAGELAGKSVIVTFDMDYFSNKDNLADEEDFEPEAHKPSADQIRGAVARAVANLKSRGVRPQAIPTCTSPDFTFEDQIPLIQETLLAALEEGGFAG